MFKGLVILPAMSLAVTGTIGIDTVHTAQTTAEKVLGGSCAYFAAAASFFSPVRLVAAVGGDWPEEHRAILSGFSGIDLGGLQPRPDSRTFAWGGRYAEHMNHRDTLFTELGVEEEEAPPVPEAFTDSEYIFLANTHPARQMGFLEPFGQRKFVVADSMDLWINIAREDLLSLLKKIEGLVINDSEAELLTEIPNAISAAKKILELGPSFVVVKKGEHGAVLVHREGMAVMPAWPATHEQVVDPTGAGDSFAGGMMGWIASTGKTDFETIQTGLAWGTMIASFALEAFSLDRLAQIDRGDLEERMKAFQTAARVG